MHSEPPSSSFTKCKLPLLGRCTSLYYEYPCGLFYVCTSCSVATKLDPPFAASQQQHQPLFLRLRWVTNPSAVNATTRKTWQHNNIYYYCGRFEAWTSMRTPKILRRSRNPRGSSYACTKETNWARYFYTHDNYDDAVTARRFYPKK